MKQHEFILDKALSQARTFPFAIPDFKMDNYKKIVGEWLATLPDR
jgi:hypothetical protein